MLHLTVEIDGFDLLDQLTRDAAEQLERELGTATFVAAEDGIIEAQQNHPYTDRTHDLTEKAHAERIDTMNSEMQWPMGYAGFVDEGTSRSAAYPFTPQAVAKAEQVLNEEAAAAVARFEAKVTR